MFWGGIVLNDYFFLSLIATYNAAIPIPMIQPQTFISASLKLDLLSSTYAWQYSVTMPIIGLIIREQIIVVR